jgi:hypothetical protein
MRLNREGYAKRLWLNIQYCLYFNTDNLVWLELQNCKVGLPGTMLAIRRQGSVRQNAPIFINFSTEASAPHDP